MNINEFKTSLFIQLLCFVFIWFMCENPFWHSTVENVKTRKILKTFPRFLIQDNLNICWALKYLALKNILKKNYLALKELSSFKKYQQFKKNSNKFRKTPLTLKLKKNTSSFKKTPATLKNTSKFKKKHQQQTFKKKNSKLKKSPATQKNTSNLKIKKNKNTSNLKKNKQ